MGSIIPRANCGSRKSPSARWGNSGRASTWGTFSPTPGLSVPFDLGRTRMGQDESLGTDIRGGYAGLSGKAQSGPHHEARRSSSHVPRICVPWVHLATSRRGTWGKSQTRWVGWWEQLELPSLERGSGRALVVERSFFSVFRAEDLISPISPTLVPSSLLLHPSPSPRDHQFVASQEVSLCLFLLCLGSASAACGEGSVSHHILHLHRRRWANTSHSSDVLDSPGLAAWMGFSAVDLSQLPKLSSQQLSSTSLRKSATAPEIGDC